MTLRVVIADDHPPTRMGVRMALEDAGMEIVAEVATADAAIAAVVERRPDLALLDIMMPGSGVRAAREIAVRTPEVAVVMLTASRDDLDLFQALSAGARGYLLKDTDPDRLPIALEGVLAGEAALPRALVARLIDEFRARDLAPGDRRDGPFGLLTEREWDVLRLMQQGLTTAEMADRLFVSTVTVRTHVAAILRKLRVRDRAEAVTLLEGRHPAKSS
jgi:DNA-binding NarL/FixJ family response regulator